MRDKIQPAMTLADLRRQRQAILALAEKYGAYNVRIFLHSVLENRLYRQ